MAVSKISVPFYSASSKWSVCASRVSQFFDGKLYLSAMLSHFVGFREAKETREDLSEESSMEQWDIFHEARLLMMLPGARSSYPSLLQSVILFSHQRHRESIR